MKIKVILNPYANRWGAQAKMAAVHKALTAKGLAYDLQATTGPGEATAVAQAALNEGFEMVIAAGGDGTINEVINGLIPAAGDGPTVPFGIIPIGTANDFNLMAGLPNDIADSINLIAAGKTRQIDAAVVNGRYFINNSAAAMEPMITLESLKIKRLSGELRYLAALVRGLIKLQAWQMQLSWDDGSYEGPAYLLSVCNSPRTGGFTMAPGAEIDDGLLDMVFAPEVSKLTVLAVLLKLMKGTHVAHPAVTFVRTKQLSFTSQPGTPVHADGEVFTESATAVDMHILPGKISLVTL